MQQEDEDIYWYVVIAYCVSVGGSILFSKVFYVLGIEDAFIRG